MPSTVEALVQRLQALGYKVTPPAPKESAARLEAAKRVLLAHGYTFTKTKP